MNLSSRTKDERIIKNTSIENMSSIVNYKDKFGVCKTTAYRNLGEEATIEGKVKIQDTKYPIDVVTGNLLNAIEENIEKKLQNKASRMFEEKIDDYDVRRSKNGNSYIGVVKDAISKAIVESSRFEIEKLTGKQYEDPVESLPSNNIYSALLNYPAAINYLKGDAEKAKKELLDRFKLNERKTLSEVEEDLEEIRSHIDVFTEEEENLIQEILEEIIEIRRGELMITLTRSSAGDETNKNTA